MGQSCRRTGTKRRPGGVTRALAGASAPAEVTTDRAAAHSRVLDELLPAAQQVTVPHANNRIEADHGRRKARRRPCAA